MSQHPDWEKIDFLIQNALSEDIGDGDATTNALFDEHEAGHGFMVAKEAGLIAGMPVARRVFQALDPDIRWEAHVEDGQEVANNTLLVDIYGSRRALLTGERLALNILQRLSGIATLTARYVARTRGTAAKILDTRKTLPGLRVLEKYAVVVGGGTNHRFGLYDAIMIKDNHIKLAGGILAAVNRVRQMNPRGLAVEVETSSIDEVKQALHARADIIMLDNMSPKEMRSAVELIDGAAQIEASGSITLETIADVAATGVNFISVGALTHSAKAFDIGMYFSTSD